MGVRTGYIVLDATDPELLATFWGGLFEVGVSARLADGQYVVLEPSGEVNRRSRSNAFPKRGR